MTDYQNPYPSSPAELEADPSGRHPVSVGHLVMGVAFLGLALVWLLFETGVVVSDDLRWFLPLPWLAAGVAGLLAVALTGRRSRPEHVGAPPHPEPAPLWTEPGATDSEDERR